MAVTRAKASTHLLGGNVAVDVLGMSPQARAQTLTSPVNPHPIVVQNTTQTFAIPVTHNCKVLNGYVMFTTVPAVSGGTSTVQVDYVASDGSTTTNIVAAQTILGLTNKVPSAFTIAATNPTSCAAGGSFLFTVATSNNTVGTADVGGQVALGIERVEDAIISDTNTAVANA